jgi:hypothetical protein
MNWPGAPPASTILEIVPPVTPGIAVESFFVLSVEAGRRRGASEDDALGIGADAVFAGEGVEARERLLERVRLVRDLEFEKGLILRELDRALAVVEAGDLDDDAVVSSLLDHGLGHPHSLDAGAHDLERPIDRRALVRHRALRLVDIQREVHSTREIEPFPQGNASRQRIVKRAVGAPLTGLHVTGKEGEDRDCDQSANESQAPLQVGHATTGWREGTAWRI